MGRARALLLMAVIAALLTGAYVLLSRQEGEKEPPPAPSPTDEAGYEMLYERPLPAFRRMEISLPEEAYAVVTDLVYDGQGNLLGVNNGLGQPIVVEGQPDFALDETAWQVMLVTVQHLPVTGKYPGLDAAACGLETPRARLRIAYAGQADVELAVGNLTSSGQGCYVRLTGDENVYIAPADFYAVITRPLLSQHALPGAWSRAADQAVQAALVEERTWMFVRQSRSGSLAGWQLQSPFVHDARTAGVEAYIAGICALHADGYAATAETAEDLAAYGLDRPCRLAAAFSDGAIRDIHLGADAGEGQVYARMDRTGDVYLLNRAQLAFLDDAGPGALLDPFVYLISSAQVSQVTIEAPEGSWVLSQTVDDDGQPSYELNDAALPSDAFSRLYAACIGIPLSDVAPAEALPGEAALTLRYQLSDGMEQTVIYSAYDDFYDLAWVNGGGVLARNTGRSALLRALAQAEEELP